MLGKYHSEETKRKISAAKTKINLCGQRFGRLTVLEYAGSSKNRHSRFLCRCECGNEKIIVGDSLIRGKTLSCGCLHRENISKMMTVHGATRDNPRLYSAWINMKDRCNNPANKYYADYGGRGITVCGEWENNVVSFVEWALLNGYDEKLTLDRVDNNGNYCPENCKWSTPKEQSRNTRRNLNITIKGETRIAAEWAKILGINAATLAARYHKGERGDVLIRPSSKKERKKHE